MEVEVRVTDTQWLLLSWAHFIAKEASRKRGRAVACGCVCARACVFWGGGIIRDRQMLQKVPSHCYKDKMGHLEM